MKLRLLSSLTVGLLCSHLTLAKDEIAEGKRRAREFKSQNLKPESTPSEAGSQSPPASAGSPKGVLQSPAVPNKSNSPAMLADIRAAAESGDAESQRTLGRMYAFGQGVTKDDSEALKWLRKAADQGLPRAQFETGIMYTQGRSVPQDHGEALRWYQKAADQEFPEAQFEIGRAYSLGRGVTIDHEEALKWFRKAGEQGLARAQFELGYMYDAGLGAPKDDAESIKWYHNSAEGGFAEAQLILAGRYGRGDGVPQSEEEATKWFKKAAEQGDPVGQFKLGLSYSDGSGVPKNSAEAMKWFRKAAEQGSGNAQLRLAVEYSPSRSKKGDPAEAYKWCLLAMTQGLENARKLSTVLEPVLTKQQRAEGQRLAREFKPKKPAIADDSPALAGATKSGSESTSSKPSQESDQPKPSSASGDARALYAIGARYFEGNGVPQNYAEALKWFRKAAEQNVPEAQFCIGQMYFLGQSVAKDPAEGMKWCRLAADQGLPDAQFYVGLRHASGNEAPKDYSEALRWFRKAADQGHADAQVAFGGMHANGRGVPKDQTEAAIWLRKAADQGHATAQASLSTACFSGDGVPKDIAEAYKWALLASTNGDNLGARVIKMLERTSTEAQLAEGQKRARAFKPRKILMPKIMAFGGDASEPAPKFSGSGFFITNDGYFISHERVGGEGTTVRISTTKGTISAKVVKLDTVNGFALLKAEGSFTALPVTPSRTARPGAAVSAVGFPNLQTGFSPTLARGEIAALAGRDDDVRHFQIQATKQPGNSGGALVDERGNVIGIVVRKPDEATALPSNGASADNVSYAVKSSYLLSFLESLPDVAAKLKDPNGQDRKFEEIMNNVEQASVFVLKD